MEKLLPGSMNSAASRCNRLHICAFIASASALLIIYATVYRIDPFILDILDLTPLNFSKTPAVSKSSGSHFNKPLEIVIHNKKDQKAVIRQNKEKAKSEERLSDMATILKFNSDPIPETSAFKTKGRKKLCVGKDASNCFPKFQHFETRLRFAPKYKTVSCLMQKSASTILQAVMCYLYDEKTFRKAGRSLTRESYHARHCKNFNEHNTHKENTLHKNKAKVTKDWLHLAVIREPVDRFLSGFVDKCLRKPVGKGYCNGCNSNITCFIISEYDRVKFQLERKAFVRSFEDRHFFPQNWRCDFKWHLPLYRLIHYGNGPNAPEHFVERLTTILKSQNVSAESLAFIREQITGGHTVHSTFASDARQFFDKRLHSSPFLMEYIVRMFYYDFVLFNYAVPDVRFPVKGR